jgi:hypothetical protein
LKLRMNSAFVSAISASYICKNETRVPDLCFAHDLLNA